MGYYTHFEIKASDTELMKTLINDGVRELDYIFDEDGESHDSYKWYGHEKDLRIISQAHPDVLFTLIGKGEEAGDLWVKYFKDGKIQRCPAKITFDEFDEAQLK